MLAIRLQRTGRSGHAQFRIIVQDARLSPKSGKVVAALGSYNPHTKVVIINTEKAKFYLDHGAQPSPRVVNIIKNEGVKLPKWVKKPAVKKGVTRNPDKYTGGQTAAPAEKGDSDVKTDESTKTDSEPDTDTKVEETAVEQASPETTEEVGEVASTKTDVPEPTEEPVPATEETSKPDEKAKAKDDTKA